MPDEPAARVVRVFVSSTFRDMGAEREELVKRIFPQLRRLCESRGVTWGEVDLRWGVTDEQKAEGQVLPICLAEIHNCRPYFIGLLGERYGWVPDEIDPGLIEQEPWLADHRGKSVTELEILHGVLNNPEMADHVFFYLRDPAYVDALRPDEQPDFQEAEEEPRRALAELKQTVGASGLPVRENYPGPRELGELVLADLTAVIDRLYPEGSEPEPLDRGAAEHEAFAASRARVYIGGAPYFDRLDAHARGDGPPLVVLGESGSGKSALLANWALHHRAAHRDDLVLMHFVSATSGSADWAAMLRRVLGGLDRRFPDLRVEIPDDANALRDAFANALHQASERGRVVLVLDALNQLDDREGAPDLVWLPPEIPPGVRLVLSTLPGRPLDELTKRGWPRLAVRPLEPPQREELIVDYLAQYRKALSPARVERIAAADRSANPLFLRALLEELRVWGDHFTLDARIDHYLAAATIDDLYERILERYEQDYERERPGLVRDAMSLLWAARRGLSEAELLDLLGSDGDPLPRAYWSPLHLAAEEALVGRSGLIGFSHDYLRKAVEDRYLPGDDGRRAAHLRLAGYFEREELGRRKLDELPWQLARGDAWRALYDLLADGPFFDAAWSSDQFELKAYWAELEDRTEFHMIDAYRPILDDPDSHLDFAWNVATLLSDAGHPEESMALRGHLVEVAREMGDMPNLQAALGNQALLLKDRGDLEGAMKLLREAEQICRELGDRDALQRVLGHQATVLLDLGRLDEAMELLEEKERICRGLGERGDLGYALANRALILRTWGDIDGAMALQREAERIARELGDRMALERSLGNQALLLKDRGDLDGAMALHEEQERIARELGSRSGLTAALVNRGGILRDRGDLDGAMELFSEAGEISRGLGDQIVLQQARGNEALIIKARGDLDGAMAIREEQERVYRQIGYTTGVHSALMGQAVILKERGDRAGSLRIYREAEQVARQLGDKTALQRTLGHTANILRHQRDLDGALALLDEAERICRELGYRAGLQSIIGQRAQVLRERGDLEGALELHRQSEEISRELGDKASLASSLGNQAHVRERLGDLDGAMAQHAEEERICRELGDQSGLQISLGNQATILRKRGDLDGAMALSKEQERISREHGYRLGVRTALTGQAWVLQAQRRFEEEMALHEECRRISEEIGDLRAAQQARLAQAVVLQQLGRIDDAMELYADCERASRELGGGKELAAALSCQAGILLFRGQSEDALSMREEEEGIWRELGNRSGLGRSLRDQGWALRELDRREEAMPRFEEAEPIFRELGDLKAVVSCMRGRAAILDDWDRLDEALALNNEAEQIAREAGDDKGLQALLGSQGVILEKSGDLEGALARYEEKERICRELGRDQGVEDAVAHQARLKGMLGTEPEEAPAT